MSKLNVQLGLLSSPFKSWDLVSNMGTGTCHSSGHHSSELENTGDCWRAGGRQRRGEWANHEMGLGACYSANSRLSPETIVGKGDREAGTRSGNLNVRAVKRAAAQQLDSRSTLQTNPLASKSARSEALLAASEGAGSLARNWFCPP